MLKTFQIIAQVAQLAGYVSEHSAYHHGEQSLCSTIVGLAQNFCGSNNLPLLEPLGQFGTRLQVSASDHHHMTHNFIMRSSHVSVSRVVKMLPVLVISLQPCRLLLVLFTTLMTIIFSSILMMMVKTLNQNGEIPPATPHCLSS